MEQSRSDRDPEVLVAQLEAMDADTCHDFVSHLHRRILLDEATLFVAAAVWADLHHPESRRTESLLPGSERPVTLGGEGTPELLEFAIGLYATGRRLSSEQGRAVIADALDTRHRLPHLWRLVQQLEVDVRRVRRVATLTRHLSVRAAGLVDRALALCIGTVSWNRFEHILTAQIIAADPELADRQAQAQERAAYVRTLREPLGTGMRSLLCRAEAGNILALDALIGRIAECLARQGDSRPIDERRAGAVAYVANPALALELLVAHAAAPDPGPRTLFDDESAPASDAPAAPKRTPDDDPVVVLDHGPDLDLGFDPDQDQPRHDDHEPEPEMPDRGVDDCSLIMKPPLADPRKLQPVVHLYIHLSLESLLAATGDEQCSSDVGVARFEDVGPVTVGAVRRFLGRAPCTIKAQPVTDLNDELPPVDAYEIPDRMREQIALTMPASQFPWSNRLSRRAQLDHADPYRTGRVGQTAVSKLQPLGSFEHRMKTHGGWDCTRPARNTTLWRSPLGQHFLVTPAGTIDLGKSAFAARVWQAAQPSN